MSEGRIRVQKIDERGQLLPLHLSIRDELQTQTSRFPKRGIIGPWNMAQ